METARINAGRLPCFCSLLHTDDAYGYHIAPKYVYAGFLWRERCFLQFRGNKMSWILWVSEVSEMISFLHQKGNSLSVSAATLRSGELGWLYWRENESKQNQTSCQTEAVYKVVIDFEKEHHWNYSLYTKFLM